MRCVGKTPISVSRVGLGCVTFGREIDEQASFRIMDYALERGITLFDTAEAYGGGQARDYRRQVLGVDDVREKSSESHSSEKIIGRWLKSRRCRDRIVLQTKVTSNFSRSHMNEAVEASLERLQTDRIDVYLLHYFEPNTSFEESLEGMTLAIEAGRVRAAGCSNFTATQLRQALEVSQRSGLARLEVIQPLYNILERGIELDLLPLCRQEHVAVVTYSPLAAGFLSGKYSTDPNSLPDGSRFHVIPAHTDIYFNDKNFRIVEELRKKAETSGVSMVRLAMGWVFCNADATSVLIGARTTDQIDNALKALAMDFPDEWLSQMDRWK